MNCPFKLYFSLVEHFQFLTMYTSTEVHQQSACNISSPRLGTHCQHSRFFPAVTTIIVNRQNHLLSLIYTSASSVVDSIQDHKSSFRGDLQGYIVNSSYYPCLSIGVFSFHYGDCLWTCTLQVPKAGCLTSWTPSEVHAEKLDLFNSKEISATSGHIRWKENTYCIVQEY